MDSRRAAACLALLLAAPAAQAQDRPRQKASSQIEVLQYLSDPADFKSYVEGSRRAPDAVLAPRAQTWSSGAGRPAQGPAARPVPIAAQAPRIPSGYGHSAAHMPIPEEIYRSRTWLPGRQELPPYPLAGLALLALGAAGLFAFAYWQEFAPASAPLPVRLPAGPAGPLTDTPSVRRLLARLDSPIEPYVDTRMPVPSWRAISLREQQLLEIWDASYEKSMGQPFAEWLDGQGALEGSFADVDVPLLKKKLDRPA